MDSQRPPRSAKGVYVVIFHLKRPCSLRVGSLGRFLFPQGYYHYAGSAFGLGGLRARIGRHMKRSPNKHWHIDALKARAAFVEAWFCVTDERLECRWAKCLASLPGASAPVPGFGASDCRCPTHLLHADQQLSLESFAKKTGSRIRRMKR